MFSPVVPFEEEVPALEAFLGAFENTGKALIFTSGTGVLSFESKQGQWHQESYSDEDPYEPQH
jgi:hypothetical protein